MCEALPVAQSLSAHSSTRLTTKGTMLGVQDVPRSQSWRMGMCEALPVARSPQAKHATIDNRAEPSLSSLFVEKRS